MCANTAYKVDKKAIPIYAILFVGDVENLFPTNYLKFYSDENSVIMRIFDILSIFVGIWVMRVYKEVFFYYPIFL